jgi:hypothetical protein
VSHLRLLLFWQDENGKHAGRVPFFEDAQEPSRGATSLRSWCRPVSVVMVGPNDRQ